MKGFTLIELLVVVLIIGILAAVALPQYETVVEKSRATEAMVNVRAILDAMQRHIQEFPEHDVANGITNCTQIADVQLKGGSWGGGCNIASAGNHTACNNNGFSVFSTANFCYDINGANNTVTVSRRVPNNNQPLYVISYTKPTSGGTSTATATTCGEDFTQVCRLFTDL